MTRHTPGKRRPSSWFVVRLAAGVLALASGGCDSDSTGAGGSIQLSVTPADLAVEQDGTGSMTATLARAGGYRRAVTLALGGLPAGITATIAPAELTTDVASATVTIAVAASVAPGSYAATLGATGPGVTQATAPLQLTVTVRPAFAIAADPAALTVVAGGNASATVMINRTNLPASIALTLLDPPGGVTGAFSPSSTTSNSTALVLSVAAGAAPGAYPLTIQGTATGHAPREAELTLTVLPVPASERVEFQFCDGGAPAFFAYQDGHGAWQPVMGSASGGMTRYAFSQAQGWGGVLMVISSESESGFGQAKRGLQRRFPAYRAGLHPRNAEGKLVASASTRANSRADTHETYVLYGATAELATAGIDDCTRHEPTRTVHGVVASVPDGAYARISFGASTEFFVGGVSTNPLTFTGVPARPTDLVGSRLVTPGSAPDRIVVMRSLDVPDGGSIPAVLDFEGPASSSPAVANVTIVGGAGDDLEAYTDVITTNAHVGLWADLAPSPAAVRPWAGLRPESMLPGDVHALIVFASGAGPFTFRVATRFAQQVANQTIALGPPLGATTVSSVASGAYPRLRFQGTLSPDYHRAAFIEVFPESGGNYYLVAATGLYLAASGNPLGYDITMPAVAGLEGFPAAARVTAGTNALLVSAVGFSGAGVYEVRPSPGSESREAYRRSTVVVQ